MRMSRPLTNILTPTSDCRLCKKKLKEAFNKIHAEKKAAQQNAAHIMKDSRKLKLKLNKIKDAAEKQAAVLKQKIDKATANEKARLELERRRKNVEQMRSVLLASEEAEIMESRKPSDNKNPGLADSS